MPIETRFSKDFREILRIVGRGRKLQRDLTLDEAAQAMRLLLSGEVSEAQIGGFLVTMRVKEETADEIIGFTQAAHEAIKPLRVPQVEGLVDVALPYNGKSRTLQTGVAALLVLAAAGIPILAHGADNIPTKTGVGVLNLLRAMNYPVDVEPDTVIASLKRTNFGVLNIGSVLPQWTDLTPIRHHFGVRILMNTVEKMLNPANAARHISGFYHSSYLIRMARALPGHEMSWIVQGEEGSIDIRPGKKTRVYRAIGDEMVETTVDATDYGFSEVVPLDAPNDAEYHAQHLQAALAGETGPVFDQIVLTAATMLWMLEAVPDIPSGIDLANSLLKQGHALRVLEKSPIIETIF